MNRIRTLSLATLALAGAGTAYALLGEGDAANTGAHSDIPFAQRFTIASSFVHYLRAIPFVAIER